MKKCFVNDPDTNLGVPIELTAADVRPYFEHQELLGRFPASDFAPHIFDQDQNLPFSLPADQPKEGLSKENRFEESRKLVPVEVPEPAPVPQAPEQIPPTSTPEPIAPQPSVRSPTIPVRLPTIPEETALETEPVS